MRTLLAALLFLPLASRAEPPEACTLLTPQEINAIASVKVEKVRVQKSGNPSQCGFMDARGGAVLVVSVREVKYAVKDEMHYERENLEKIYRSRAKHLDTVADGGFWLAANKQMGFRKRNLIVSVTFSTAPNQNEIDSAQIARLIESRL